jgi:hypothetical protein
MGGQLLSPSTSNRPYHDDDVVPIQRVITFLRSNRSGIVSDVLSLFLSDLNSHNNG